MGLPKKRTKFLRRIRLSEALFELTYSCLFADDVPGALHLVFGLFGFFEQVARTVSQME